MMNVILKKQQKQNQHRNNLHVHHPPVVLSVSNIDAISEQEMSCFVTLKTKTNIHRFIRSVHLYVKVLRIDILLLICFNYRM